MHADSESWKDSRQSGNLTATASDKDKYSPLALTRWPHVRSQRENPFGFHSLLIPYKSNLVLKSFMLGHRSHKSSAKSVGDGWITSNRICLPPVTAALRSGLSSTTKTEWPPITTTHISCGTRTHLDPPNLVSDLGTLCILEYIDIVYISKLQVVYFHVSLLTVKTCTLKTSSQHYFARYFPFPFVHTPYFMLPINLWPQRTAGTDKTHIYFFTNRKGQRVVAEGSQLSVITLESSCSVKTL